MPLSLKAAIVTASVAVDVDVAVAVAVDITLVLPVVLAVAVFVGFHALVIAENAAFTDAVTHAFGTFYHQSKAKSPSVKMTSEYALFRAAINVTEYLKHYEAEVHS